jgi:GNAT superfamily N-acetyltransferase
VGETVQGLPPGTRLAVAEDSPRIAEICLSATREAMPWLNLVQSDDEVRAWFAREHQQKQQVWVSEPNGSITAYMSLNQDREWVEHLYVDPNSQGRGQGTALLELAKSLSSGRLRLHVFQRNMRARDFYEHRDFRAVEFGDGTANREREPDVTYLWERGAAPDRPPCRQTPATLTVRRCRLLPTPGP